MLCKSCNIYSNKHKGPICNKFIQKDFLMNCVNNIKHEQPVLLPHRSPADPHDPFSHWLCRSGIASWVEPRSRPAVNFTVLLKRVIRKVEGSRNQQNYNHQHSFVCSSGTLPSCMSGFVCQPLFGLLHNTRSLASVCSPAAMSFSSREFDFPFWSEAILGETPHLWRYYQKKVHAGAVTFS